MHITLRPRTNLALLAVLVVGLLAAGCYRPCRGSPVPLFRGLVSQQAPEAVKRQLGAGHKWEVVREEKGPVDGRPRFDFLVVNVGQMADRGQTGDVELGFYNDRLMSVYFRPADPSAYFGALSQLPGARLRDPRIVAVPGGAEVWRVRAATDGPLIMWVDPCLREEQDSWIMEFS